MGNLLGSPVTDKETHTGETVCGCKYGVSSMQGWRVHMEDAHICQPQLYAQASASSQKIELPDHALFAVFDGHGGSYAAEYAGINFCRVLSRQPKFVEYATFVQERSSKEPSDKKSAEYAQYLRKGEELLEGALRDAFVACDKEILLAMQGTPEPEAHAPYHEPEPITDIPADPAAADTKADVPQPNDDEDPGTTIVVVVVTPEWVVCANAGDSRAVFSKSGGKAVPLSYDHKPDDEAEEKRIREAGGYVAGGRVEGDLAVSRGLGDFRFKEVNTVLKANDTSNDGGKSNNDEAENMLAVEDQKVSPIPDVIVQNRNKNLDEFILVACDGIYDVASNYEAVKMVADIFAEGESDLGLVAEEMLDMCLMMGSKDNMTALVLQFEAQKVGEGGGVTARRQKREEAENTSGKEGSAEEEKGSTLYT